MDRSESIGALATALSALQGELSHVGKNSHGYGYDYADLAAVLDVARPLLAKHGLALSQLPAESDGDTVALESVLMHTSGEWISARYTMSVEQGKGMSKAQAVGSVITYARRYALTAIMGIAQTDDDAAVKTAEKPKEKRTQISTAPKDEKPRDPNGITEAQGKKIWAMATGLFGSDSAKDRLRRICIGQQLPESSKDMTTAQASALIEFLTKMVKERG